MIGREILDNVKKSEFHIMVSKLLDGFQIDKGKLTTILSCLSSHHHLLILGPPGSGKTALALRLADILGQIKVVQGCPLRCAPENPSCPWCKNVKAVPLPVTKTISGLERLVRVQGHEGLAPEDLIGGLDPEIAVREGIYSINAFVPGKLLRANRGILLIDFIDRIPERVFNSILCAVQDGEIMIGRSEEVIKIDTLIIGTGGPRTLHLLPSELLDCFDVIVLDYSITPKTEKEIVLRHLREDESGKIPSDQMDLALEVCQKTRKHYDIQRGVSIRGSISYAEYMSSLKMLEKSESNDLIRFTSSVCLPHRIQLSTRASLVQKSEQIIGTIVDEVLHSSERGKGILTLSQKDIVKFVQEVTGNDHIRNPLKYGTLDLLLSRLHRFPESCLYHFLEQAKYHLKELYPDRYGSDSLTDEVLFEVEEIRILEERMFKMRRELEMKALSKVLDVLEKEEIIAKEKEGWGLGRRSFSFLLEELEPKIPVNILSYGYGTHPVGRKLFSGEGKIVHLRPYHFGDRYRDISFKATIKNTIRQRRNTIQKEDIMVEIKEIRTKLDVIILLDLSGTMTQLQKLWYAKQSAITLNLAAKVFGDRVGIVSFSNLSSIVSDLSLNTYRLIKTVVDLDIHKNAFTNIGAGILKALEIFGRHRGSRAGRHIILISDGDATAPHPSPQKHALKQAAKAIQKGITISCICIASESTDPELMRRISKIGRGRTYIVADEDQRWVVLDDFLKSRS